MRSRLHSWVDDRGGWIGNGGNANVPNVRGSRFETQVLPSGRACGEVFGRVGGWGVKEGCDVQAAAASADADGM